MQEDFAGDAAAVQAGAAQAISLDKADFTAKLDGADRSDVTARPCTDNGQVVIHWAFPRLISERCALVREAEDCSLKASFRHLQVTWAALIVGTNKMGERMNLGEPESAADPVADVETSRRLYGRYQLVVLIGGVGIILWLASPVFWSHYHRWQFENGPTDSRLNAEAYFIGQGAESLDYLLKRLRHPHPEVRAISAHALGQIGDRRAVQPLIAHLEDDNEERTVVEASAIALGLIGDFRAGAALMKALDGDFLFIRYYSALSLVRLTGQNIAIDRPAWESWWNDQKHLPPIPKRKRPKGSAFLLSSQQLIEKHFYKAVVGTAQDKMALAGPSIGSSPRSRSESSIE